MRTFLDDLRHGLRGYLARPGFTLAAVVALALGLGANMAIFTVADAVVFRPLPYAEPDRLVTLWETNLVDGLDRERLSPVNFMDYRALSGVYEDAAGWWHPEVNLTYRQGEPLRVTTVETSGNLFSVLGVVAHLGPGFTDPEELQGEAPEVVVSHRLWRGRLGGDPGILGRAVHLNGDPYTVVGVMPPGFTFPGETDAWQRLEWNFANHSRYAHFLDAVARLRPGVTPEQADRETAALAARLAQEHLASNKDWGTRVESLHADVVGTYRPALLVLLGAVGLLLLMACANVANLLLARATVRGREVAIRAALGAGRGRLVRQFLAESLLLGVVSAALGLALANLVVGLLVRFQPVDIPRLAEVALDGRVLAFGLAATLATVVLFGLAPAIHASRADLQLTLKEGGRSASAGRGSQGARRALIVGEVAVAVVLLVGAGLLIRSFFRLLEEAPGFRPAGVVTVNVELPQALYREWSDVARFYGDLLERLEAHPAIGAAGATGFLPLEPGWRIHYAVPGRPPAAEGEEPEAQFVTVTPGYFESLRIPLLSGRTFDRRDTADSAAAVVVSRELARRAFPDGRAVGSFLGSPVVGIGPLGRSLKGRTDFEIVGVVGDVKNNTLKNASEPAVYFVHTQFPYRNMNLVVRGRSAGGEAAGAARLAAVLRGELRRLDPGLAPTDPRTLEGVLADDAAQARFLMLLMSGFAALALVLAAVGIYGVLSYAVSQRRAEIGVRLALGATAVSVRGLVVREGLALTALGLALGGVAAAALARFMASLLFGVAARDAATFTGAPAVLLAVALAACYLPARRASRVDPLEAIRTE